MFKTSQNTPAASNGKKKVVFDSWEQELDANAPALTAALTSPRFPNLTRLSLAKPGHFASWHQLLAASVSLSTLTHLSLAYWPIPNTTPNSKTAFMVNGHVQIPLGGTNLYSTLHKQWQEPANILRRLSLNTYCLKWLDLEGCNEWLPALTWMGDDDDPTMDRWVEQTPHRNPHNRITGMVGNFELDDTGRGIVSRGPDWNGSWAQITYVNVSQGIIPCDIASIRSRPAGVIATGLLLWLREQDNQEQGSEVEPRQQQLRRNIHVPSWLEREAEARDVAATVRTLRKSGGGAFCAFDYGWSPPVPGAKKTEA